MSTIPVAFNHGVFLLFNTNVVLDVVYSTVFDMYLVGMLCFYPCLYVACFIKLP